MWLASLCSLFSVVNPAVNMALPAFAAECRAAAPGSAPSLLRGHSPLWIDISCQHGTQQQTRRTPLQRSNDGTDGRTDGHCLSVVQTDGRSTVHKPCSANYVGSAKNARYTYCFPRRKKMVTTPQLLSIFDTTYSSYSLMI